MRGSSGLNENPPREVAPMVDFFWKCWLGLETAGLETAGARKLLRLENCWG